MKGLMPIETRDMIVMQTMNLTEIVNGILDCYKGISIAKEEQLTLRNQIREQSRACIAAIEANTRKFVMALESCRNERMELVNKICDIVQQTNLDEYSLHLCKLILDYLLKTNPMDYVGFFKH